MWKHSWRKAEYKTWATVLFSSVLRNLTLVPKERAHPLKQKSLPTMTSDRQIHWQLHVLHRPLQPDRSASLNCPDSLGFIWSYFLGRDVGTCREWRKFWVSEVLSECVLFTGVRSCQGPVGKSILWVRLRGMTMPSSRNQVQMFTVFAENCLP